MSSSPVFEVFASPNAVVVFNAGLVIFGSLLVPQFGLKTAFGGNRKLERGKHVLGKAIEALSCIGNGITLIDRCIACLQRLLQILEECGKKTFLVTCVYQQDTNCADSVRASHPLGHL